MAANSQILVVGSVNMDLAVRCPHIPVPGETVLGSTLIESPGGKGANQGVAAVRLGGRTAMLGCVGTDAYGRTLRAALVDAGVAADHLLDRGTRSGVAIIEVSDSGENSIVVVPGANALLAPDDVERALDGMPEARLVLLQLEIPLETVIATARAARSRGLCVLLDPAPAQPLPDSLLGDVDILTPNQTEAALLAGLSAVGPDQAQEAARRLLARGPRSVLVKLGAEGVLLAGPSDALLIPGWRLATVDSTAAGDCLSGALAVALIERRDLPDAVAFANAAAALSTTRYGAQDSMPTRAEVDQLLSQGM